jgi:hypothetical protein
MVGELCDFLFLTGLGRKDGPPLARLLAVHATGATVGIVFGFLATSWLPAAAGMAFAGALAGVLAAVLGARGRSLAAAALAAVLVELTTFAGVRFLLWFRAGVLPPP